MFLVFSGVYSLCVMGSLSAAEAVSDIPLEEVAAEESTVSSLTIKVAPDGIRNLTIAPSIHFIAKPSSLGVWEISGDTASGKVAGVLKIESQNRGVFSGTVFLKSGQLLTTQVVKVLADGGLKATDLISEQTYSFTRADLVKGPDASMSDEKVSALSSCLSFLSATADAGII
jgi:hypothetical protein